MANSSPLSILIAWELHCLILKKIQLFCWEVVKEKGISTSPQLFFDLASLTKPLTLASTYSYYPELFDENKLLLLNHCAGLPMGGRLSKGRWKEELNAYHIKESPELYSDYSALRLMLELPKLSKTFWHPDLVFWKNIKDKSLCPITGTRGGKAIQGEVNDHNAWAIDEFCSHAGLFATVNGLAQSLLRWQGEQDFIGLMKNELAKVPAKRFVAGWDRVLDPHNTLAGKGCGKATFGHLGFTGTSIWIDAGRAVGHIILSNATQKYFYDREGLKHLRQELGAALWQEADHGFA